MAFNIPFSLSRRLEEKVMMELRRANAHIKAKLSFLKQELLLQGGQVREIRANFLFNFPIDKSLQSIRQVRNWVNTYSIHLIDREHDQYAFKINKVIPKLWFAYADNLDKPHLSCGPRTYAMKEILRWFGIKSRVVDVFHIQGMKVNPHTLLEVYLPSEQAWVAQDPDFNVEYTLSGEKAPLQVWDMITCANNQKIAYQTNGYNIENEKNCTNTIRDCFYIGALYRYSYEGKCSIFRSAIEHNFNRNLQLGNSKISFNNYLNDRGAYPVKIDHKNLRE